LKEVLMAKAQVQFFDDTRIEVGLTPHMTEEQAYDLGAEETLERATTFDVWLALHLPDDEEGPGPTTVLLAESLTRLDATRKLHEVFQGIAEQFDVPDLPPTTRQ